MSANKVTLSVGILGFRTDATDNPLQHDGEYENICVLKPLGPLNIPSLEDLRSKIHSSNTESGDAVSAIVVAIDIIEKYTKLKTGKPAKTARKIVLVTDGQGGIDDDSLDVSPFVLFSKSTPQYPSHIANQHSQSLRG